MIRISADNNKENINSIEQVPVKIRLNHYKPD